MIRSIIETYEHTLKSDRCFLTHRSLDDFNLNGNIPPVWASVGLAVQDSNASFGSVTSSPLFLCSFMKLGPEPAFGRLGLGGSSGGYSSHGRTSHASLRAYGAHLEGLASH